MQFEAAPTPVAQQLEKEYVARRRANFRALVEQLVTLATASKKAAVSAPLYLLRLILDASFGLAGTVVPYAPCDPAAFVSAKTDATGGSTCERPPDVAPLFDQEYCDSAMAISEGGSVVTMTASKKWCVLLGSKAMPPGSGVHSWSLRVDKCNG